MRRRKRNLSKEPGQYPSGGQCTSDQLFSCFQVNHLCFRSLPSRAGREQIHRRMHTAGGNLHRFQSGECRTGFCPVWLPFPGEFMPGDRKRCDSLWFCASGFLSFPDSKPRKTVRLNDDWSFLIASDSACENERGWTGLTSHGGKETADA